MSVRTDQMKADAQAFYDLMFNQSRPAEAIDRYVGESYIQHNPDVADGKQAFIDYFDSSQRQRDVLSEREGTQ
jgi:predicted SnoaL-like aldol condensation-catalyzing enzyme